MPARSNACSELTRFWLEARHGCLTQESIPVAVPYATSDIDILALRADESRISLPDGSLLGPRLIVETKDEHDWEPLGREFAQALVRDVELMGQKLYIPRGARGVKFTMLREEHYDVACQTFGSDDFDRLFVVHALDRSISEPVVEALAARRIRFLDLRSLTVDLAAWYGSHARPPQLRNTLVGDLLHLLWGYCGFRVPEPAG